VPLPSQRRLPPPLALADAAGAHVGPPLHDREFRRLRDLLRSQAGIELGAEKKCLVINRLHRRIVALGLAGYREYLELVLGPGGEAERQTAVDLLTTNETYFFREPAHFRYLHEWVTARDRPARRWRVWSAACSSGEEPYSIAMTLADALAGERFEVMASDISRRVLERAVLGHYPLARMEHFPPGHLKRFCLKGHGPEQGTMLIDRALAGKVSFRAVNLSQPLPQGSSYDIVFLRNVLIYFDKETKRSVLARVEQTIPAGGLLFVSHSESLFGLTDRLVLERPGVYRKEAG
jgi:chemotaxis protein methyltransferase CheR